VLRLMPMFKIPTRAAALFVLVASTLVAQSADWNVVKALAPGCVSPKPKPATASRRERTSRAAHWLFNSVKFARMAS
jgi:hypothetical protein